MGELSTTVAVALEWWGHQVAQAVGQWQEVGGSATGSEAARWLCNRK